MVLDHVAFLVPSLESVLQKDICKAYTKQEIETFPSEGTREMYVHDPDKLGKLLFIEAIDVGPYREAARKRGFGLHHIAILVPSLSLFCDMVAQKGLYIHPKSVSSDFRKTGVLWFCRPGLPFLLEVIEQGNKPDFSLNNPFVEKFDICVSEEIMDHTTLCAFFADIRINLERNTETSLWIQSKQHLVSHFC